MKPIVNDLSGTEFLQEKSLRSKYLPSPEKRLWTSLAVENQKIAADGSPEFQSSMVRVSGIPGNGNEKSSPVSRSLGCGKKWVKWVLKMY